MKHCVMLLLLTITFSAYAQTPSTLKIVNHIDSVVSAIDARQNFLLQECDSVADINTDKMYKYWNYYFKDSSKKEVCKVAIASNNCAEEFYFYYINNKPVLVKKIQ